MPFAEVNGARLFFTDEGSGPFTALLLHQLSGDSHDWSWVIPLLQECHRVVAVDLRGHGSSSRPDSYELLEDFVGDLVALVRDLGCDGLVPVGHSFGGAVATVMAVEHPSLVRAVVEVDPAYALSERHVAMWREFRTDWDTNAKPGEDLTVYRRSPPPAPSTPAFVETWRHRRIQAMSPDVFWKTFDGLANGPQKLFAASAAADDYLGRRSCPVLSFHSQPGRAAWETPLLQHPLSRAVEWEGSGHSLQVERPVELCSVTTAWLESLLSADRQQASA